MHSKIFRKLFLSRVSTSLVATLSIMACATLFSSQAMAHGYIVSPPSRAYLCSTGVNILCGAIQYEPQSTEAVGGFPATGPADGKIASANGVFSPMDEQTPTRWAKVPVSPGPITFTWHLTARHAATNFRYYITKPNWNPNEPLTRADFDLTPFCVIDYNGEQPAADITHHCTLPDRTGYQIILGVYEVDDTPNAFYHVIDADFGGAPPMGGDNDGYESGPCAGVEVWHATMAYGSGDQAHYNGNLYTAKYWTQGNTPSDGGPWSLTDSCGAPSDGGGNPPPSSGNPPPSSGNPPPSSGNPPPSSGNPPPSSGNPPPSSGGDTSCSGASQYVDGNSYATGDIVQNNGHEYQCTVGGWCSTGGAYAPGTGWASANAWHDLGACSS